MNRIFSGKNFFVRHIAQKKQTEKENGAKTPNGIPDTGIFPEKFFCGRPDDGKRAGEASGRGKRERKAGGGKMCLRATWHGEMA